MSDERPGPVLRVVARADGRSAKPLKQPSNRLRRTTTVIGTWGEPSPSFSMQSSRMYLAWTWSRYMVWAGLQPFGS